MRKFRWVLYFSFSSLWLFAQRVDRHADNWLFGSQSSIYFPFGGEPGISNLNNIPTDNAFMTYSDESGNLVLYSNGKSVWNASGDMIDGAADLIDASNPNYPGLIVPIPETERSKRKMARSKSSQNP